jgi:hypothetical protein
MTRTDDELLALAAKAGGIDTAKAWAPLADDGDALRLMVRLNISAGSSADADIGGASWADSDAWTYCSVLHNGDAGAATRRAIVECAAKIGARP